MCTSQDRLRIYRNYIDKLISAMNKIDDNDDGELDGIENITDISILKDILDMEVEEIFVIPKEHTDFRTRRHAVLFFNYWNYLQFLKGVGIEHNLRTDILAQ